MYFDCNYLLLKNSADERVKYSSTRIWNVFQTVVISCRKLLWGESQIQFYKNMECILGCNYLLLKFLQGRYSKQFHKDVEYILDCNYFQWKLLWGESQIQFREDMECILGCNSLSLKNSAVERVRYSSTRIWNVFLDRNYLLLRNSAGESQIQLHRERESALDCNYLFLKSSSGERVKYSSTGIWNVF